MSIGTRQPNRQSCRLIENHHRPTYTAMRMNRNKSNWSIMATRNCPVWARRPSTTTFWTSSLASRRANASYKSEFIPISRQVGKTVGENYKFTFFLSLTLSLTRCQILVFFKRRWFGKFASSSWHRRHEWEHSQEISFRFHWFCGRFYDWHCFGRYILPK